MPEPKIQNQKEPKIDLKKNVCSWAQLAGFLTLFARRMSCPCQVKCTKWGLCEVYRFESRANWPAVRSWAQLGGFVTLLARRMSCPCKVYADGKTLYCVA